MLSKLPTVLDWNRFIVTVSKPMVDASMNSFFLEERELFHIHHKTAYEKWCNTRVNHGHYQFICETRFFFRKKVFQTGLHLICDSIAHLFPWTCTLTIMCYIICSLWVCMAASLWRRTNFLSVLDQTIVAD